MPRRRSRCTEAVSRLPRAPGGKQGLHPINGCPTRAETRRVTTISRRYVNTRRRAGTCFHCDLTRTTKARKAQVKRISMDSYEVDAHAVAEAIVRRLLAGHG